MAARFNGTSSYLWLAQALVVQPCVVACWFRPDSYPAAQTLIGIGSASAPSHFHQLQVNSGGASMTITSQAGATPANATVSGLAAAPGVWAHAIGIFGSSATADASRRGVFNGNPGTVNLQSKVVANLEQLSIGAHLAASASNFFNGLIAHAAVWNAPLVAEELRALGGGESPLRVRRDALVGYWPLIGGLTNTVENSAASRMQAVNVTFDASGPPRMRDAKLRGPRIFK